MKINCTQKTWMHANSINALRDEIAAGTGLTPYYLHVQNHKLWFCSWDKPKTTRTNDYRVTYKLQLSFWDKHLSVQCLGVKGWPGSRAGKKVTNTCLSLLHAFLQGPCTFFHVTSHGVGIFLRGLKDNNA